MTRDHRAAPVRLAPPGERSADSARPDAHLLDQVAAEAAAVAHRPLSDLIAWAPRLGTLTPELATGRTLLRWELLATVGAVDLTVARVVEPHLDALSILHENGDDVPPGSAWGVYAAEGPPPRLEASRAASSSAGWVLSGRKPWCSLAGDLTHALVTAWVDPTRRGLFAVDLGDPGVRVGPGDWAPRGLTAVISTPVDMDHVAGREVGGPGWYLEREGFAWGGIGVAAVWYGGAVGIARRLHAQTAAREPDQVALMHLGRVDAALHAARAVLHEAAGLVDAGTTTGERAALLAARVRHVVSTTAETVLTEVGHALGPGPLSLEPDHAARVADLTLYLRQHHAARDEAASGRLAAKVAGVAGVAELAGPTPPW